jgi:hypothetical protein
MSLAVVPVTLKEANAFIVAYHRHHKPINNGYRFCLGVADDGRLCGVAIGGNPLSQYLKNGLTAQVWLFSWSENPMEIGLTAEVRRTCTDGTRNANSMLYGACQRAAKAMGFKRLITYTFKEESGASLRAVGWINEGLHGGGSWDVDGRHRQPSLFVEKKWRWSVAI